MTLPKLNDVPKYTLTIPSTNKTIRYRPYLMKEEKVLMMALESNDPRQMLNAVADTISACVQEPIDVKLLTPFDIEYMFVQLRSKAVGEIAKVGLTCKKCNHVNEVAIKVDNIEVTQSKEVSNVIKLSDTVKLKMKWPSYSDIISIPNFAQLTQAEQVIELIIVSMDSVQTDEENLKISDEPREEIISFIESLNTAQFKMINDYVESMPKMTHKVDTVCEKCGEHHQMTLSGIKDFF